MSSAKRPFRGGNKPKKQQTPSPSNLMSQVQKMQTEMTSAQEELANKSVTVTVGGGAISITISGHQRVQEIKLNPELLNPEDVEMLQDLLVSGMNQAIEQSQSMSAEKMEGITGGLNLGGGFQDILKQIGGF